MKKPKNYTLVMYALMLAVAFSIGYLIINFFGGEMSTSRPGLVAVGFYALAFLLTSLFYEIGHVIFAKIAGFKVTSINILGIEIGHFNGKTKFFYNGKYDGFVGETRVVAAKEVTKPTLYFIGGFITVMLLNVILLLVDLLVPQIKANAPDFYYGIFCMVSLSTLMVVYCMLPLNIDSITGGVAMKCTRNGKFAEYNKLCDLRESLRNGDKLENLELMEEVNPLVCTYNLYVFNSYFFAGNYEKANEVADYMVSQSSNFAVTSFDKIIADKVLAYAKLSTKEEMIDFYNNKMDANTRSRLGKLDTIEACRANLVLTGLILDNEIATNKVLKAYDHLIKNIFETGIKEQEQDLANALLKEVQLVHTDWTVNF